jgi:hypothetical protein
VGAIGKSLRLSKIYDLRDSHSLLKIVYLEKDGGGDIYVKKEKG